MEKEQTKENILPSTKNINLMELFPKILNVEKDHFKMTPSEYIKEMSLTLEERHKKLSHLSNYGKMWDNNYPPQFRIVPQVLMFQRFEPLSTHSLILEAKNVGKGLLPVKMHCPTSIYFSANFVGVPTTKLAPGLSVEYEIIFTPKEAKDYQHYLLFTSKEQTFQVPIIAIGPRPMLDIPDQIILNPSPVKILTSKYIIVRNIGEAPAVFTFISQSKHFQVSPSKGILGVHDSMMLNISFESSKVEEVTGSLYLVLETGERLTITLHGSAENVSVRLEKNSVVHEDTFLGLKRCRTVRLINNSSSVIKFSWKKNKTLQEDLHIIESMKNTYKELMEVEILKDAKVIYYGLSNAEEHKISCERILKDELRLLENEEFQFCHEAFGIMPQNGEVWPKGSVDILVTFDPKVAGPVSAEAYLEVSGRDSRLPLRIRGNGLGPKLILNVKTLDIDYIYLCSEHKYELTVENKGDIPGTIEYFEEPLIFGGKIEMIPQSRYLKPGELGGFVLTFTSNRSGDFTEKLYFIIKESEERIFLVFKGKIVSPTLHFDIKEIDFGTVPFGVPKKRQATLNNLSMVPVSFSLRVLPDGEFPSISDQQFAKFTIKPSVATNPKEFQVQPEESVVEPYSSKIVTVILTANKEGRFQKQLVVDIWDLETGSASCPIKYKAVIATLVVEPKVIAIPYCFINYPYTKSLLLSNKSTVAGFYYIVPVDPNLDSQVTFSACKPQGNIESGKVIEIDITVITTALGRQNLPINILTFGFEHPQQMCSIACLGQGPVVLVEPNNLEFGNVPLLETVKEELEFTNDSPIPASLSISGAKPNLPWSVDPSDLTILPQKSTIVTISLFLKDRGKFKETMKINIYNGKEILIPLHAVGVGSSLRITPNISPTYNLNTLFSQKKYEFEILVENKGNKMQSLLWSPFSDCKKFSTLKYTIPEDYVFKVFPSKMDIMPDESKTMTLEVYSKTIGSFFQNYYCIGNSSSVNKEIHLTSLMKAEFVKPAISCDRNEIYFWNNTGSDGNEQKLKDAVAVTNTSILPYFVRASTSHPFCIEKENGECTSSLEFQLEGLEKKELNVMFIAPPNPNKISRTYHGKVFLSIKDQASATSVTLVGEMSYPNVKIQPQKVDFGYIHVGTNACAEITLINVSPLTVHFDIKWNSEASQIVYLEKQVYLDSLYPEYNGDSEPQNVEFELRQNSTEEIQVDETECTAMNTAAESLHSLVPPSKPVPKMPDIEISNSDIKEALFPLTRSYYICDNELIDAYKLAQCPDTENAVINAEYNKFCDITPFYGKLEPYCSQILTVAFFSSVPVNVHLEAILNLESGPTEVITIEGISSEVDFELSTNQLDFGKQLFCETKSLALKIQNNGSMPFCFEADSGKECLCELEQNFPLGKEMMTVSPKSGTIKSFQCAELVVRYLPGVPGMFESTFTLQIAHLDPIPIKVKGFGVFPQVYISLPRPDILQIDPEVGYNAVASISPDWMLTGSDLDKCMYHLDTLKPYRSRESNFIEFLEDDSIGEKWEVIKREDSMPSEIDIYLAVERTLSYKLISKDSNNSIFSVFARTIPRFNVPAYDLDFKVCIIGQAVEERVTVINFGPLPAVIYGIFDSQLKEKGISVRLKNRNELKIGECLLFNVTFHPKKCMFKNKYKRVESVFYFEIYHGPKIPIRVLAEVTYPYVEPSMEIMDFGEVLCGCCKVISLRLKNPGMVSARWSMFFKSQNEGNPAKNFTVNVNDSPQMFHVGENSGYLDPNEYCTVEVFFKPLSGDTFSTTLCIQVAKGLETVKIALLGCGIKPTLDFTKKVLNFKTTLPFPPNAEKIFSVSNPCPFPIEFYFSEFDEQILEEDKIIRAVCLYYQKTEILLPVRQPGDGLPVEIIEFYNMLLDNLNVKFMSEEREKMLAERDGMEESSTTLISYETDSLLGLSQSIEFENKKKKPRKMSRSRTAMESARMPFNSTSKEPVTGSIFEKKTQEEIDEMLEEYIKILWSQDVSYDPVHAVIRSVLPPEKEEEYKDGCLIICHGAPNTNSVLLANRLANFVNMRALSIDYIVLSEAAFGRCEAGLMVKDLIDQAYCEFVGLEEKECIALEEWEANNFLPPEDQEFSFDRNFEEIQHKFNALLEYRNNLKDNLQSGKMDRRKSGTMNSAKSDTSKKAGKEMTPIKPQMNLNAAIANISEELVVEVLRYRLALEVNEGLIIEGLRSSLFELPVNALISVLKAAGNIKDIMVITFMSNYAQYTEYLLNLQTEQELAKYYVQEEILNILEEDPEEVFESLNLDPVEANAFRELFLMKRNESHKLFLKKQEVFYEMEKLKREALKQGLPVPTMPINLPQENVIQVEKKEKDSGKKRESDKGVKNSEAGKESKKTATEVKSAGFKKDMIEGEFMSFEMDFIEMKAIIDNWDQRIGAVIVDSIPDVKNKKGQTPRRNESLTSEKPPKGRGIFLWLVDVSKPYNNSFSGCCEHLKICLQERRAPSESEGWPLQTAESMVFSVFSLPPQRVKDSSQQVFTISVTENVMLEEDFYEDIGEYVPSTAMINVNQATAKLNRSASSISFKSKRKGSGTSKRKRTDSRMSTDARGLKTRKPSSYNAADENQVKPRYILQPGQMVSYRVKYYPTEPGNWSHDYVLFFSNWRSKEIVQCKGISDYPRIDMQPEVLFPEVEYNKPLISVSVPAYYHSDKAYDFGSVIIFQSSDKKTCTKKTVTLTLCNISTISVDLTLVWEGAGMTETPGISENFEVEPDKIWLKPEEKQTVVVTANPSNLGLMSENLLFVIKDNPQVDCIQMKCEGVKPSVSISPIIVNFERLLLHRKELRRVVLVNDNLNHLYFHIKSPEGMPPQLTISDTSGWIPPLNCFAMEVYYSATEVQLINELPILVEVFDSLGSKDRIQDLTFVISAEAYDAALDIIFANQGDDHLDFGDIRVECFYTIEFSLKNVGKYQLGYKTDVDLLLVQKSGIEEFHVFPQDGKLPPGKLFPITVTLMAETEISWKKESLIKVLLVEPFHADELIATIPIEVSARSHFSRYEIKPAEQLNFGHIPVGSGSTISLLIENKGHFSLSYFITLQSTAPFLEEESGKKSTKVSASSKEKVDKAKKVSHSIKAGIFEISPSSGTVEIGRTAVVNVACCPSEVRNFEEKIVVSISESLPHLKKGNLMTVSAQACLPTVNFKDYKSIFREHFVFKNETEFNSRNLFGSHTVYTENNNFFSFKNICVNKTAEARLHIQNVGLIDCSVTASVINSGHQEGSRTIAPPEGSQCFGVSPEKVIIEPYTDGCFVLTFQPDALEVFRGQLTLTLVMPESYPNMVQVFELKGNGILPQIEITEPVLKLPEGQALVNFPLISPGHTCTSSIAFSNTGVLDCKVIIELYKVQQGVFTLTPKPGTEKMLKIWELAKPIEHTAIVSLSPAQVAEFTVNFTPPEVQSYLGHIKLFVVDNPFENWCYKLQGEVFFEEVVIEKIRTTMPFLAKDEKEAPLPPTVTPGQYYVNFGDCYVKKKVNVLLRLSNKTEKEYFKFEWDEIQCVCISPATGHLYPKSYKDILLMFYPDEPMELEDVTITCVLNKILFPNPPSPSWDARLVQYQKPLKTDSSARSYDKSSLDLTKISGEEPQHEVVPESNSSLYVNLMGIADYTRLTCETTKIVFKNTFMFQTRMYPLVLENSGNVALEYKLSLNSVTIWPLKESKKSQVGEKSLLRLSKANTRPKSSVNFLSRCSSSVLSSQKCWIGPRPFTSVSVLDLNSTSDTDEPSPEECIEEQKPSLFNPFTVENAVGRIPAREKTSCNIVFSPMDINEFRATIIIQVANLHPECVIPEIEVKASSIMPYCHFDIPESDYLESGRRVHSKPGPIGYAPGVPLDPETKTIEIKVLGIGVNVPIKFHVINPTEEDYTFSWVNTTQIQPDVIQSFHCTTVDGWVRAGRQQLMVFNFVSQKIGITESFWKFSIPKFGVETPFLLVADVREPAVFLLSSHINLMPTLIGSSSSDVITFVNHEENPFDFNFLPESLYSEGRLNVLKVEPSSGKILPTTEMSIGVTFTGKTAGKTLFNLKCKVKNIKEPFVISVEATTYAVQPLVVFEDLKKVKKYPELNVENVIDFGSELSPNIPETITVIFTSLSKVSFYYDWDYNPRLLEVKHCNLRFSPQSGHVASFSRGKCDITILFKKKNCLLNFPVKLKIRRGPIFHFVIVGSASTPLYEFSFTSYDFGYCFLQEKDTCFNETFLTIRNKDPTDLCFECSGLESTEFSYSLPKTVLPPGKEMVIPISFRPKQCIAYADVLKFTINGKYERIVNLTGHGTELKITLVNPDDITISLGAVKIGKSSTRKFSIINKSLAAANVLVGFSDQLPVSSWLLAKPKEASVDLSLGHRLTDIITISPSTPFKIKPQEVQTLSIAYKPKQRTLPLSETISIQCQERVEPLCMVTGCCLGPEISLDRNFLNFGAIVKSCTSSLKLKLINSGGIGARFEWDVASLSEYYISPTYGYCSPESNVTIKVTFCPSAVQTCISRSVECKLYLSENETYPSLRLEMIGDCVALPEPKDIVTFECFVRKTDTKILKIENPSGNEWQLMPIISGEYFRGHDALLIPVLSSASYQVDYCPLTMSKEEHYHKGSVFFKLPNGQGLMYQLKGISLPPNPEEVIEREIPCKTKYVELLKIKNWLHYPQRFKVNINCVENQDDPTSSCTGFEYLEVPALAQKEYSLNFFAYNTGHQKYTVVFLNEETGEYVWYEIRFNIHMCGTLELITLKSGVRQTAKHELKLENPLNFSIVYHLETTSPEVTFKSAICEVPARQSVYVTVSFTPLHPGEKTETLTVSCPELGVFPRELRLTAAEVLPEPTTTFETPLGTITSKDFLIKNFSNANAVLLCQVDSDDFEVAEQASVPAGESTKIKVSYEPSEIATTTATLSVKSEQAGNFIFPLLGMCVKPLAKGPIIIKAGAGVSIPFKNVFKTEKEFYMYVDNPAFFLKTAQETLSSKEEGKIFVGFQKTKNLEYLSEYRDAEINPKFPMMGQLVVECVNPYVKWQFYLKGVLEK